MAADRLLRLLVRLQEEATSVPPAPEDLARTAVGALDVTGAAIVLFSGDPTPTCVASSDSVAAHLSRLQAELGEGPDWDAHRTGQAILEPDLGKARASPWPSYAAGAEDLGVCAAFVVPMQVGAAQLGVLSLYRDAPGGLTPEQHADLFVLAEVATRVVLDLAESTPHTSDWLAGGLLGFDNVVHQATGMVSVQLGVSLDVALMRLRAHAFAEGRSITEISRDVLSRDLRFHPESPPSEPTS